MAQSDRLSQLLDETLGLLGQQREMILRGEADALAPLAEILQSRVATLATVRNQPIPQAYRLQLDALLLRAQGNQEMVNARQEQVRRSLDELGRSSASLQGLCTGRMYAAAGRLEQPLGRGRSLAQA